MPYLSTALGDAKESEIVPDAEHQIECTFVVLQRNKADTHDMMVTTDQIQDPPRGIDFPAPIKTYFRVPNPDDDPEVKNRDNLKICRYLAMKGVSYGEDGFDTDDVLGSTGTCPIRTDPGDDEYPEPKNTLFPPKLRSED